MNRGPFRLPPDDTGTIGRLIDRTQPLRFTFDGRRLTGFAGDSLASALLGAGIATVGRSTRLHRRRGIMGGVPGASDPQVTIGSSADLRLNRAPAEIALSEGLMVRSQGAWPFLGFDVAAFASGWRAALAPGAAYKMRVRPQRLWDRAARLARYGAVRANRWPAPASADHAPIMREVDVVVAGGGLAGLAAAEAAAAAGLSVILAERTSLLGGIADGYDGLIEGEAIGAWIAAHVAALAARDHVEILTSAAVAALAPGTALIVERPNAPIPLQRLWQVSAGAIVLATGAAEKPLVFPGNHGPGVMLAGAARLLLRRYGVAPGRRVVIATSSDEGHRTALDLHAAGIAVERVVDLRLQSEGPMAYIARAQGLRMALGSEPVGVARGRGGLPAAVTVANRLSADGVALRTEIPCEALLVSGGWSPNVALATGAGATLAFDPACGAFRIAEASPGLLVAGAADGRFNMAEALDDGWRAGIAAAAHVRGRAVNPALPVRDCTVSADPPPEPVAFSPDPATPTERARAMVDAAGDVSVQDIAAALAEGYGAPAQLARYARLGLNIGDEAGTTLAAAVAGRLTGLAPAALPGGGTLLAVPIGLGALAHDPEKWEPAFGQDHAQSKT